MTDQSDLARKNRKTARTITIVVVFMIALSFAFVPLYNMFCRATGFGGTTQVATQAPAPEDVLARTVTVKFNASTARNMPWHFAPQQREVTVKLGEKVKIIYVARNDSNETITGTALYNVTPEKAGKFFHKIQCFCFDEQTLKPGETKEFPVVFYVDPSLDKNPDMADMDVITLSYSFFRAGSSELDKAMKNF